MTYDFATDLSIGKIPGDLKLTSPIVLMPISN
jgi:hypothetical protein